MIQPATSDWRLDMSLSTAKIAKLCDLELEMNRLLNYFIKKDMNKDASSMYGVLSYQDYYDLKDEFVKVAKSIEIHPAQLEWLYNHDYYILKYREIYQIHYSRNAGFYATLIYKADNPLTKRGRWDHAKAETINSIIGFNLLRC